MQTKRAKSPRCPVIKMVKRTHISAPAREKPNHRVCFQDLCGVWTADEEKHFREAIKDLETVNPAEVL